MEHKMYPKYCFCCPEEIKEEEKSTCDIQQWDWVNGQDREEWCCRDLPVSVQEGNSPIFNQGTSQLVFAFVLAAL